MYWAHSLSQTSPSGYMKTLCWRQKILLMCLTRAFFLYHQGYGSRRNSPPRSCDTGGHTPWQTMVLAGESTHPLLENMSLVLCPVCHGLWNNAPEGQIKTIITDFFCATSKISDEHCPLLHGSGARHQNLSHLGQGVGPRKWSVGSRPHLF